MTEDRELKLVEVWGDVVDIVHLCWAVVLGCICSLPAYLVAVEVFQTFVDTESLAKTYALLVGLAGCLVAGTLSAKRFPPKRILEQDAQDPAAQAEALDELREETGDLGEIADLPPAAIEELKALGVYDLFAGAQERAEREREPRTNTTGEVS